ncbi:MAG TPA: NifB/NifX family molybdenum-iron cluster-binding protein [Spirochaetales bacterium]|nr:NifB/NifX family molybdenum-iron cluster-binding protein [Spirochaetales bacterium]
MPRPHCPRKIARTTALECAQKKRCCAQETVILTLDQAEALRLADIEGLYQEAAARAMGISRQTFGRILDSAHRIVTDAVLNNKTIVIAGGIYTIKEEQTMHSKIAVPTKNGSVDAHFGHCEYFTVFEIGNGTIASEKRIESPNGCGCKSDIASKLAQDGVTLMLAGNIGDGAIRVLKAHGIEVVRGASGTVRSVVEQWIAGTLKDSGETCHEHGEHECTH